MSEKVIEIENVVKTYDEDVHALRGCNLIVKKGEMVAIRGVSGSGKSTLLNILGLLDTQFDGKFIFCGENAKNLNERQCAEFRNSRIGFVVQDFALVEDMTVYMNICIPFNYSKKRIPEKEREERVKKLLIQLGIEDKVKKRVSDLSGGQRQRVAIARALANNPEIILADEPTGSLDSATTGEIMNLLTTLNKCGITIIIVTHDISVSKMCTTRYIMKDGCLYSDDV